MSKNQINGPAELGQTQVVGRAAWHWWAAGSPPGVQRASSATSTSKLDNKGGWVVLEEPPHCPFDMSDVCRTGARRDYHQPGWKAAVLQSGCRPSATGGTTILSGRI